MKSHPVVLVYKLLTYIITPNMAKPENVQGKCSCCERPAEEFNYLGYRLFNSYKQPVIHCPPCQSFFVSAPDIMGIENPRKPTTGQKFGMWSGVGALVSVSNRCSVLFAPPGVVSKLPATFFKQINVVTATTSQHIDYLLNTELQYPVIYIQSFGRKTYELVRSLRVSDNSDALYACSDALMTRTNEISFRIVTSGQNGLPETQESGDPVIYQAPPKTRNSLKAGMRFIQDGVFDEIL
ncbi:hypothetical protein EIU44_21830 [Salmonella enterica]|nr:hypothetical protein [Salmonella enterica]ECE6874209.1 hypothetical protein [Salmonella enterica subsp. houtenae]EHP9585207.1 hypothetical protein [Salmonella enterica subsp. houtenae serovar 50:g,z51:-]EAR9301842.1 hypothetical protein [Salmonella enterica]EDW0377230.1 hypothetical protein [Salmonella enterica subsp. houtenae]